ncbi:MAG: diaminopimelate epimerase [Pseudomonadales bacterium]
MLLRFTKMHGLGNDFVMLDLISQQTQLSQKLITRLADRRLGIGFDQLLTIGPPDDPDLDFKYNIYNADGSEAEQCGNGARCALHFVRDQKLTDKTQIRLGTINGTLDCQLKKDGNVTVDLGPPLLAPSMIPFLADAEATSYQVTLPSDEGKSLCLTAINVGNPHAVITVEDVRRAPVQEVGSVMECHPRFPERVNVGFMEVVSRQAIKLRVFERGLGETRACGSGACAAVVAGRLQGKLDEEVDVELPGGLLKVSWAGDGANIMMTGPACRVYEGQVQL